MAAKKAIAQTRIIHGEGEDRKVFEEGETVTGLPKDAMQDLLDAGAIAAQDPAEVPVGGENADEDYPLGGGEPNTGTANDPDNDAKVADPKK